ncbi:MAG TPA: ROK family protein [Bacillales bacterium]|nr:ROK family protein [Bacillales bacterium]
MGKVWAGVDIGGTKVAIALVDERGKVVSEETIPTEVEKGPDHTAANINAVLEKLFEKSGHEVQGIGIGSPGPLNANKGLILKPSNLPTWIDYPIVEKVKNRFPSMPVSLGNDADLAGLGEYLFSLEGDHPYAAYVTVSTGVGGGIISNGRLHTGASSSAAEFGHMIFEKDGPLCGCGRNGCVETFSSGTGIANRMTEQVLQDENHPLFELARTNQLSAKEVFAAFDEDDPLARQVIEKAEDALAITLANVITALNPSVFIIGGGVALGQPRYIEAVKAKVGLYAMEENVEAVTFVQAKLGSNVGVIGAAALAMEDRY